MKKQLLAFVLASAAILSAQAQPFFTQTSYRGAFAPAPAEPWTAGWTNFNPKSTNYSPANPADTVVVPTGTITTATTWTANKVYHIRGYVYVETGVTLTIQPGTVIRAVGKSALIIRRGASINANGTMAAPIVFTSLKVGNARNYGDWGGLVLCGSAMHNLAAGVNASAEGDILAQHGGSNDADNSGILRYVRIEFAGQPLSSAANSELNGLSLYSIGSGTQIDHVQVSYSGDDSFEWFGGTVDAKYLVAYRGWDDDFDTDNGFRGRVQFAVGYRDPNIADQSGSNGFESDNDGQGSLRTPRTAAVFSNVTVIGPLHNGQATASAQYTQALHIRRRSSISIFNSIFTGFPRAGLRLESRGTVGAYKAGLLVFKNNIIAGIPGNNDYFLPAPFTANSILISSDTLGINNSSDIYPIALASGYGNDTLASSNGVNLTGPFLSPTVITTPDARPAAGSLAASGASFADPKLPLSTQKRLKGLSNATALVYPNPATTSATVDLDISRASTISIEITDLTGRLVTQIAPRALGLGNHQININTSNLAPGIYLITIANQTSQATQRLVIGK